MKVPMEVNPLSYELSPDCGLVLMWDDKGNEHIIADLNTQKNINGLFANCGFERLPDGLEEFPEATSAMYCFYGMQSLKEFKVALPKLQNGSNMFNMCYNLAQWNVSLPSLTNGDRMFQSSGVKVFDEEMPALASSLDMFSWSALRIFRSRMPSLTSARAMFFSANSLHTVDVGVLKSLKDCNIFLDGHSRLSSLNAEFPQASTNTAQCLTGCRIDRPSSVRVLRSLPDRSALSQQTFGMGCLAFDMTHPDTALPCEGCLTVVAGTGETVRKYDFADVLHATEAKNWVCSLTYFNNIGSGSAVTPVRDETLEEYEERTRI